MSIEKIKDESVRKLAETLRSSGMAASDTEAVRMAEEMSSTVNKVQKSYDEQDVKKEESVEKPESVMESTKTEDVIARTENAEQHFDQEDSDLTPINSNLDADKLFEEQKDTINSSYGSDLDTGKTVNELVEDNPQESESEAAEEIYSDSQSAYPEQVYEKPKPSEEVNVSKSEQPQSVDINDEPNEFIASEVPETQPQEEQPKAQSEVKPELQQAPEQSKQPDDGYEVDETVEIPVNKEEKTEEEKQKARDEAPESKIDLNNVFNFGK